MSGHIPVRTHTVHHLGGLPGAVMGALAGTFIARLLVGLIGRITPLRTAARSMRRR